MPKEDITEMKPFSHTSYFLLLVATAAGGALLLILVSLALKFAEIEQSMRAQTLLTFIGLWTTILGFEVNLIIKGRTDVTRIKAETQKELVLSERQAYSPTTPAATATVNVDTKAQSEPEEVPEPENEPRAAVTQKWLPSPEREYPPITPEPEHFASDPDLTAVKVDLATIQVVIEENKFNNKDEFLQRVREKAGQ